MVGGREPVTSVSATITYRDLSLLLLKLFAVSAEVTLVHHSVGCVIPWVVAGHSRTR